MAFKIQSLETMKSLCEELDNYNGYHLSEFTNTAISRIESIKSAVSGKGVDQTLQNLLDSIKTTSETAKKLISDTSMFIKTQTGSYVENEENISTALTDVQSALDSIVI